MDLEHLTKAELIELLKAATRKDDQVKEIPKDVEEKRKASLENQKELQKERNRVLRVSNGRWSSIEKLERDENKMQQVVM